MENNYLEQVSEVKYLVQDNTYRYRLIMKYLFLKYEEAEYWQYKEEIHSEIKKIINNYTLEECERDLDFLLNNGSVTKLQDTQNVNTINDFKFHNFRYQITDKAVVVERMITELEELEVKVSSLELRLFDRIGSLIKRLVDIYELNENQIYEIWTDLNNDFKSLNEHYQDFLKRFHEAKTEELLQSDAFFNFKSSVINYINEFINSYIKNSTNIKNSLLEIDENKTKYLMDKLVLYQEKIPKISDKFDYDKLRKLNYGKWQSINKWFISANGISEGERLLEATQNVIHKIYKYASSLIELHGNMINRKEEYKHICSLFDKVNNIEDANKLAMVIFGNLKICHYKFAPSINTDSLIKSYDVDPIEIMVDPSFKEYKNTSVHSIIVDKTLEKKKLLDFALEKENEKKEKIKKLISSGIIELKDEILLDEIERRYVLDLIEKYNGQEAKESEFGYSYSIIDYPNDRCKIISSDGIFELPGKRILIKIGENYG